MNSRRGKVIVGLSGGVDSALAAARLLHAGYVVEGLFMKNWEEDDEPGYCAAEADMDMAREVAGILEIPLHKANYAADYWHRVFARFLDEYEAGRTPNPDILCNREIKFPALLDHARRLGAEHVATGHYAAVQHTGHGSRLLRAEDEGKDQTYFLYGLDQEQLHAALFPLGEWLKSDVRAQARALGLPNHSRKDSTGICFIGEKRFRDFLSRYLRAAPGEICTPEGRVLGQHPGLMYFTLGQRQGLGIGGVEGAGDAPWYVVGKDTAGNRLIVAQGADHPLLLSTGLSAVDPHWILGTPAVGAPLSARIRHRQPLQAARITRIDANELQVRFETPQRAVTPGQSIVFYRDRECLGGAVIRAACSESGSPDPV
ncbi:tRNA (5-methylaminomethyl-2-thiouridylate)-methyltransferase [Thioalkalivibrio nitratireducens DSM 14787]|uniref:tRNA-specific 2-thiouridylase MnmA n=1 Tax=Thioalkalivibrio nitratireducens (strain DSM 14787 / UNIQEM 213 / ALEN2) TaxID=1255043 RepID=L0DW86_THIND|nr:tRNA 2-thiouridine(34) synthase MnmA [Thioalkalivibrio nitratireducens]AGA33240.1 tRNA (5-methylaminomethyl-2-thiouridylate)-methyltransferase [Thioalkalivibrio nitratireducens DSM 14787]